MARDEYFSFGEEELAEEGEDVGLEGRSPAAVIDPPAEGGPSASGPAGAEMRAGATRGDSDLDSSERARPSSGLPRLLVVLALALVTVLVGHVVVSSLGGSGGAGQRPSGSQLGGEAGAVEDPVSPPAPRARARASRERQQVRRRRERTRQRARRSRQRRRARRRREASAHANAASSEAPPPAAPTYVPAPEPAPEERAPDTEQSAPPAREGYADGSHSPEFGL